MNSPTPDIGGPMVVVQHQDTCEAYHAAGQGFVTEDLREATRYHASPELTHLTIDPLASTGHNISGLILIDVDAIEPNCVRAHWGAKPLCLCPNNLQGEAFAILTPLLWNLVSAAGVPFGLSVKVHSPDGTRKGMGIVNVAFALPEGIDDLLVAMPSHLEPRYRQVSGQLRLMGYRYKGGSRQKGVSIWQRQIGSHQLSLTTGSSSNPMLVALESHPIRLLSLTLGRSFPDVQASLAELTQLAKTAGSTQLAEAFEKAFPNPFPMSIPTIP